MPDVGGVGGVVLCMQVYGWLGVWLLLVIEPIRLHYYWPPQYHQSEQVGVRCHYDVTTMSLRCHKPTLVSVIRVKFLKFEICLSPQPCLSCTEIGEVVKYYEFHSPVSE